MVQAWVELRPDGEYQLVVDQELFEGFHPVQLPDGTTALRQGSSADRCPFISPYGKTPDTLEVAVDPTNFSNREDMISFLSEVRQCVEFAEGRQFLRKSALNDPQLLIMLSKSVMLYLVGRKVFSKAQDKLADLVADDITKLYQLVRTSATAMARYTIPKNRPITYILVAPGDPAVEFVARTTDPEIVIAAMREKPLRDALARSQFLQTSLHATRVQYLLHESGNWKLNYLLTDTGEIIGTEASFERRARRIKLMGIEQEDTNTQPS